MQAFDVLEKKKSKFMKEPTQEGIKSQIKPEADEMEVLRSFHETQKYYNSNLRQMLERMTTFKNDYSHYSQKMITKEEFKVL